MLPGITSDFVAQSVVPTAVRVDITELKKMPMWPLNQDLLEDRRMYEKEKDSSSRGSGF